MEKKEALDEVAREVIELTTWRNIRKYVTISGLLWIALDLAITLAVVLMVADATKDHDLERARESCKNSKTLVTIVRNQVLEERKDSSKLRQSGDTFGLTPEKFDELVEKARLRNEKYIAQLDILAAQDCQALK